MDNKTYRVMIADDEAPARHRLRELLEQDADVSAIIEAKDGLEAVEKIRKEQPDLIFLDVQMPGLDGLGVIESIGAVNMPLTVFVTAFDKHAVSAFESCALDYVLKPYSDERIETALSRAKKRIGEIQLGEFGQSLLRVLDKRNGGEKYIDRVVVKNKDKTEFLPVANIDCIESAGVYVLLHVGKRQVIHRATLTDLASRLDPQIFIRVHRSSLINIERISHLEPVSHGEFDVVLQNGMKLRASRTYRASLEARLGQSL